jgi:uncharacterized membrane protein
VEVVKDGQEDPAFLFWCAYVAHYACATGDTWASEVGVLAQSPPRLITSFFLRQVPPGTNGGMSMLGTTASISGGIFIGSVFYLLSFVTIDSPSSRSQFPMVILGGLCGLLGSLLDSLLGATVQASYFSKERKCIVKRSDKDFKSDKSIIKISGIDLLSNEEVNLVSIVLTMLFSLYLGPFVFCHYDSTQCLK